MDVNSVTVKDVILKILEAFLLIEIKNSLKKNQVGEADPIVTILIVIKKPTEI